MKKILLFLLVVTLSSCGLVGDTKNSTRSEAEKIQALVGDWHTIIKSRKGSFDVYLNLRQDGTGRMWGKSGSERRDESFNWSSNGNSIYLHSKKQRGVGEFLILSIDNNSMVLHPKGEPDDEKLFFTRRR